jgi:nitrate/nitrite transporter NarK
MPAIVALSLLNVAVYVEAAVIVVLLVALVVTFLRAVVWMWDCEQAEAECEEARKTLHTLRRMSEIRVEVVSRLRGFGR